jgi:hypothetical protein
MSAGERGAVTPSRSDWLEAGLIALALLFLYALTTPHTVGLEDDGLFILSSYFLGIEHPPGYPLHTLLGKLFTYLPVGSVAYRVHLLSGVLGALSCAFLFMCARLLVRGRLAAYVAALGLGVSKVFWSQAIIAEVYTLNTLFFFSLAYLGLRLAPAYSDVANAPHALRRLVGMAFLFGLSLSNHWPLMLLVAPGFAALLWPLLRKQLAALPLLLLMVAIGLLPYAWLVLNSWSGLIISFYGPLESWQEFWYFVSRQGYANVDVSPASSWLDHLAYFRFVGQVILAQFAIVGGVIAAVGFWRQWHAWGTRVSLFLTLAFVGPTFVLTLLLGFEYDAFHKHMFHVYPLPAYGVAALWMGLGAHWLVERLRLSMRQAAIAATFLLGLVFAVGLHSNVESDDWAARYADTLLKTLPQNAIVFVGGEADLGPLGYYHMIEGRRPDITLYQPQGLVLGNRLFHVLRASTPLMRERITALIDHDSRPVVFTQGYIDGYARHDRWLYRELDKTDPDRKHVTVEIPEEMQRFFEQSIMNVSEENAWVAYFQGELRRIYAALLMSSQAHDRPLDERSRRQIEALSHDFYGALGLAEGMIASKGRYSLGEALALLEAARDAMPSDIGKLHQAKFFELRGYLRLERGDRVGAIDDLQAAVKLWPVTANSATVSLDRLYAEAHDQSARHAMWSLIKR